jgi:hypothetical protein
MPLVPGGPPSEWVWSPAPTHEPLTTKALFEAAAATARVRQGSRTASGPSRHPQAARSYPLRSYVVCDLCGRRMFGKTRRDLAYYACEPDQRHHAQRSAWQPGHPASLWVREDILLDVVHGFFAERIFGPARRELLAAQLARHAPGPEPDRTAGRAGMLRQSISDIERRKRALIAELEAQPCGGDSGTTLTPPASTGRPSSAGSPNWSPSTAPRPANSPSWQSSRTSPARPTPVCSQLCRSCHSG